ncbi:hypothetical protein JCM8115_003758 [Rhodotorula mucilaginosa]
MAAATAPQAGGLAPLASHPVVSEPPLEACLLLAQAVAQQGTKDWDAIANLLENSQYWPAEAGKMTSQGYQGAFDEIMRERGLDPEQCAEPLARPSRHLVHLLYSSLLSSLRQSILTSFEEEARLKDEIESIRAGKMDDDLLLLEADEAGVTVTPGGEADSGTEETTPKKGLASSALRKTAGPRSTGGRASGRSRRTPAATTEGGDVVVTESVEPETDPGTTTATATKVKTEEDWSRGRQVDGVEQTEEAARDGGDDDDNHDDAAMTTADGEGNGDEVEGEGDEQTEGEDETKLKRSRGRRATKSSSAAAAVAQKGKKRKQSEPPASSPTRGTTPAAADDGNKRRKRVKTTEEPADIEEKDTKAAVQRRKVAFTRIIEQLQAEKYSHYFESRVTRSIAPMYNTAVRRPTCLKDVLKAIKSGAISNSTELMRDVALLCANAIQFNGDEGEESVGHCAKLLWDRFERLVDETLSTLLATGESS